MMMVRMVRTMVYCFLRKVIDDGKDGKDGEDDDSEDDGVLF